MATREDFDSLIDIMVGDFKRKVQEGLTLAEFGETLSTFLAASSRAAARLALEGDGKMAAVVEAAGKVYDVAIPLLPIPWWLKWLLPALRGVFLTYVQGQIQYLYDYVVGKAV